MNKIANPANAQSKSRDRSRRVESTIVIVERSPHVRELQINFLARAGYTVHYAVDGQAALELIKLIAPALVITEILVPKLDGLALCRQLKSDPNTRQIAVLICSILAAKERAAEAGADAFLKKPLAEQRLVDITRGILAGRQPAA